MAAQFEAGDSICSGIIEKSTDDIRNKEKWNNNWRQTSLTLESNKESQEEYIQPCSWNQK